MSHSISPLHPTRFFVRWMILLLVATIAIDASAQSHRRKKKRSWKEKVEYADSIRLEIRRASDEGRLLQWGDSILRARRDSGSMDEKKYNALRKRLVKYDQLLHAGNAILAERYQRINYDTAYIMRPPGRWTIKLRGNLSGAWIRTTGRNGEDQYHTEVESDFRGTLSMAVAYRGLGAAVALNPMKLAGKSQDYELNVNSYSKDAGGACDFADLLAELDRIPGDYVLRFMTSHPKDASRKLIDVMADSVHVAHQFHLPMQSGSDRILRVMNRHYDTAQYLATVDYLRARMPDVTLTSDIIVGFPGETEAEFEDTLSLVEQVRYDSAYTFIYSPRKGTRAAEMPDQIPEEVKQERYDRLMTLQHGVSLAQNKARVGTTCRVLVEKKRGSRYVGRSEYEAPETDGSIFFGSEEPCEIGSFVNVKITAAKAYDLMGERV